MSTPETPTVVLLDDDPHFTALAQRILSTTGYRIEVFNDAESFSRSLVRLVPDVVCLDLQLSSGDGGGGGMSVLASLQTMNPALPVVMLTGIDRCDLIVAAMRAGAYDYLVKPVQAEKLIATVRHSVGQFRMKLRLEAYEREAERPGYSGMLGRSRPMRELFQQLERVSRSDATVLIRGEVGCGKTLVAKAIHDRSARARKPFEIFDCSSVAEAWQEPTLLGYERGAFRGATLRTGGLLDAANGGTLLVNEVSASSGAIQSALALLLQRRQFRRVGSPHSLAADVRCVATTKTDLAHLTATGRFREDVYYRLAVVELHVPPLRERPEDIPLLAEAFLLQRHHPRQPGGEQPRLSPEVQRLLVSYHWPGNVLELSNAVQHAAIKAHNRPITVTDFPPEIVANPVAGLKHSAESVLVEPPEPLAAVERRAIEATLAAHRWNLTAAARDLKIGRTTLYRKMGLYGLRRLRARTERAPVAESNEP